MNKEEHISVITDREELYDKCENMEQLFDKYYLPLLDKHYSKIYELQQENKQLKDNWIKLKEFMSYENIGRLFDMGYDANDFINEIDDKIKELEQGSDSKNIEESIQQIETLIEAWQLDEAYSNQTDINAIQFLLKENQELKKQLEENKDKINLDYLKVFGQGPDPYFFYDFHRI